MLRNGIALHSAFCNNGNDLLCLQCWTRAKKNFGTFLFAFHLHPPASPGQAGVVVMAACWGGHRVEEGLGLSRGLGQGFLELQPVWVWEICVSLPGGDSSIYAPNSRGCDRNAQSTPGSSGTAQVHLMSWEPTGL